MPKLYMLVGMPAAGKSTWREANKGDAVIISTDDIIDQTAAARGSTYNETFKENIKFATQIAEQRAKDAFDANQDVIWDQTNLSKKSRKGKLAKVPSHYEKIAVFFDIPNEEEWQRRLNNRPGKTIPPHIIDSMYEMVEVPELDEGFDQINKISSTN